MISAIECFFALAELFCFWIRSVGCRYDTFFQSGRDKETKSAASMPYFDGDYWPGSADDLLANIEKDGLGKGSKQLGKNKGQTKKNAAMKNNRGGKQSTSAGVGTAKLEPFDAQLMEQLGEVSMHWLSHTKLESFEVQLM